MNEIKLTNENGSFSIAVTAEELSMHEMIDELIIPMFMSAGYSFDVIRKYFHSPERY